MTVAGTRVKPARKIYRNSETEFLWLSEFSTFREGRANTISTQKLRFELIPKERISTRNCTSHRAKSLQRGTRIRTTRTTAAIQLSLHQEQHEATSNKNKLIGSKGFVRTSILKRIGSIAVAWRPGCNNVRILLKITLDTLLFRLAFFSFLGCFVWGASNPKSALNGCSLPLSVSFFSVMQLCMEILWWMRLARQDDN